jgi:hypothetical protein
MSDPQEVKTSKFFSFDGKQYSKDGNWGDKDASGGYKETMLGEEVTVHPNSNAKKLVSRRGKQKIEINPDRTNWFIGFHNNIHQYPKGENLKSNYIDEIGGKQKLVETTSYDKIVQKIGEVWYGAEWNNTDKIFVISGAKKYNTPKKMEEEYVKGEGNPFGTQLKGWGKKNIKDAISIIKGFDKEPTKEKPTISPEEMEFSKKAVEITTSNFKKFAGVYDSKSKLFKPVDGGNKSISDWRNQMKKDKKTRTSADSLVGTLYAYLTVNGRSGDPQWLTATLSKFPIEKRMSMLESSGKIYQHWVQTLYTPTIWWEKPFTLEGEHFDSMPTTLRQVQANLDNARVKHVMPSVWNKRGGDLPDGEHGEEIASQTEALDYAGYSSVKQMKHAIASYISSEYGDPTGYWKMGDQPKGAFFSRGVPPAKYGTIGKDLTPLQVQQGMEFLKTGLNPEIKDDVPENHYNNSLSIYQEFGSPYGELAPANMFFRIALSGTGWRKQEAITSQTQELASYPADPDSLKKLKSGIYLDKEFGLGVKFMTRKTAKYDAPDHTSNIPPFSSDLIDTTETINIILKQANVGQIYVEYEKFQNKDGEWQLKFKSGFPKFVPASEEDKKKWHPQKRTFKFSGMKETSELAMNVSAGDTPKYLVGANNQFFPEDQGELLDNTEESKISWDAQMVRAYLYFPFKEMYAVMKGTGVKIRTPEEIKKVREEDRSFLIEKLGKTGFPVFDMFDKPTEAKTMQRGKMKFGKAFATFCGKGCKPKFLGKIAIGFNNVQKMNQDDYRYNDESGGGIGYWISRPAHSIRHIFAQTWLKIFDWNYGLVSDYGHWQVMETLKENYGKIPPDLAKKQIADGFAKTWTEEEGEKAQQFAESRSSLIKKSITDTAIENLQTEIEGTEPTETEDMGDEDE